VVSCLKRLSIIDFHNNRSSEVNKISRFASNRLMNPINHPLPGRLWVVRLADMLAGRVKNHVIIWPSGHKAGLGDQITRAMDSISANIAEGYARVHVKERLHFFSIAQGSLEETLRHLRRARDRNLVTKLEAYTLFDLLVKLSKGLDRLGKTQTPR
jgi:four helix bundle protein